MAGTIAAAVIALLGALIVGYSTQFVAEDFKRFRDGSALAAGLAGELASYEFALPMLRSGLVQISGEISAGRRAAVVFRPIERPTDLYFEKVVEKLGLLGPHFVQQIVYVYSNLRAFRMALEMVSTKHAEMADLEVIQRLQLCLEALDRAENVGRPLVKNLHNRADASFSFRWPWSRRRPVPEAAPL